MLLLACIALGAFLYRWRGGPAWLGGPRWLKLAACAAALNAGAFLALRWPVLPLPAVAALAGFLVALWGVSRAHGSYYDLGQVGAGTEADWRPLELLLSGVHWLPLREGLLLAITGLAATAGPGLAVVVLGDWSGWLLAAAGALKAPAYAIGWRLASGSRATEIGEWLTGAAWGAAVGALINL